MEETIPLALGLEVEDMALTFKKSSRSDIQKLNNFSSFLPPFLVVSLKQNITYLFWLYIPVITCWKLEAVKCHPDTIVKVTKQLINPLTPMADQERISPYNVNTISTRYEMRIKKTINLGIIRWLNTKFSELAL